VLIADDHAPTRAMIRGAVEQGGFEVVAEAPDADGAVERVRELVPDVALLDVRMPGDGLRAAERIAASRPEVAIVMLTVSDDEEDFFTALAVGASGYLVKGQDPAEIPRALGRVLSGGAAVDATLARRLVEEFRAGTGRRLSDRLPNGARLTPKEGEVVERLADGLTTREIAEQLLVAEVTVRTHLSNIYRKLDARDRAEALAMVQGSARAPVPPGPEEAGPDPSGADGSVDRVLDDLSWIVESRTRTEQQLADRVAAARALGASWARIGAALGMTRQSAWQRFSGEG
jgi:DNA-binding NarL/FixJ family response regulator